MSAFAFLAALWLSHTQEARLPIPEAGLQKKAEELVREVFKEEYRSKDPATRRALAVKLHAQALDTKDDATARFVLLHESAEIAAEAGEVKLATAATRLTANLYAVKTTDLTRAILDKLRRSATAPEAATALAEAYLAFADELLAAEDAEGAIAAAREAESVAAKAKQLQLVTRSRAKQKQVGDLKQQLATLNEAKRKLSQSPDDADACLVVGKHLCFVNGDWEKGLPLVAKGSELTLKAMAQADLAGPTDAAAQAKVGDGWWDLAEKSGATQKPQLYSRAQYWYRLALPGVKGLSKAKLESRLPPKWIPIFDGRSLDFLSDGCKPGWNVVDGALSKVATVNESAQTREEFQDGEFRIEFEPRNLTRLKFCVHQGSRGEDAVMLQGAALQALQGKVHEIAFSVRGSDVKAFIDGKSVALTDNSAAAKGHIHIWGEGEGLRILAIEQKVGEVDLQSGLVGRWLFNEGSGKKISDSSGKGVDGEVKGGGQWMQGPEGTGFQFDGACHVSCDARSMPSLGSAITIAWSHLLKRPSPKEQMILCLDNMDVKAVIAIGYGGNGTFGVWKWVQEFLVSAPEPAAGEWHSFAYSFDRKTHCLYVDGALVATSTLEPSPQAKPNRLEFGRWGGTSALNPTYHLAGALREIRIYDRALNGAEVRSLVRKKEGTK